MTDSEREHPGYGRLGEDPDKRGHRVGAILLTIFATVLIAGAVAAWAYDGTKGDEIASGITVSGVDIGGLTAAQAYHQLERDLVHPLRRPIRVVRGDSEWVLTADEIDVRAGIAAAVNQALDASRGPSLPGRVIRYITGGDVNEEFTPTYRYSKPAVTEFVKEVAADVNRDPVNASVEPTGVSLQVVEAQPGESLRDRLLTEQIEEAIFDPRAPRVYRAKTIEVDPEVTSEGIAGQYPVYLTVDRSGYTLRLWNNLELVKTYPVALGQVGYDTPSGLYSIQNKAVDPVWSVPNSDWAGDLAGQVIPGGVPENPLKARWLGVSGPVGIHGTAESGSLGSSASRGCIRMAVPDVIELYDQVPVGTPIYIS